MAKIYGNTTTTPIDPKKFGGLGGNIITKEYISEIPSVGEAFEISPNMASGIYLMRKGARFYVVTNRETKSGCVTSEHSILPEFVADVDTELSISDTEWLEMGNKRRKNIYINAIKDDTQLYCCSIFTYEWEETYPDGETVIIEATFNRVDQTGGGSGIDKEYVDNAIAQAITETLNTEV